MMGIRAGRKSVVTTWLSSRTTWLENRVLLSGQGGGHFGPIAAFITPLDPSVYASSVAESTPSGKPFFDFSIARIAASLNLGTGDAGPTDAIQGPVPNAPASVFRPLAPIVLAGTASAASSLGVGLPSGVLLRELMIPHDGFLASALKTNLGQSHSEDLSPFPSSSNAMQPARGWPQGGLTICDSLATTDATRDDLMHPMRLSQLPPAATDMTSGGGPSSSDVSVQQRLDLASHRIREMFVEIRALQAAAGNGSNNSDPMGAGGENGGLPGGMQGPSFATPQLSPQQHFLAKSPELLGGGGAANDQGGSSPHGPSTQASSMTSAIQAVLNGNGASNVPIAATPGNGGGFATIAAPFSAGLVLGPNPTGYFGQPPTTAPLAGQLPKGLPVPGLILVSLGDSGTPVGLFGRNGIARGKETQEIAPETLAGTEIPLEETSLVGQSADPSSPSTGADLSLIATNPLDPAAWEAAVERLLDGFEELLGNVGESAPDPAYLPWVVGAGLTLAASEIARRARSRPTFKIALVNGSMVDALRRRPRR